jgi:hypothetical protein
MERAINPILDVLPGSVTVNGREYLLDTDFRLYFSYHRLLEYNDMNDEEKRFRAIRIFFPVNDIYDNDIDELYEILKIYFNKCEKAKAQGNEPKHFDLMIDSGRIFAAFLQVYGLDLRPGKARLDLWTFLDLLEGLPTGTKLSEVIELRGRSTKDLKDARQITALKKLQHYYRVEDDGLIET